MPGGRGPRKKAQGGYQKPSNPAPVSGVGAGARRTDGGPSQPVRPIPGGDYGSRKASVELQQGAPMAAAAPTPTHQRAPGASAPPLGAPDPFGPTRRPGEPVTAGAMLGPGRTPGGAESSIDRLRGVYSRFPYEGLRDIIEELEARG